MIKGIRAVEWTEGRRGHPKRFRWKIEIMYEGSTAWVPITFKELSRAPKRRSREEGEAK